MATVFISYSHVDFEDAEAIAQVLSEQQVDFFRDVKDIEWGDAISSEVRAALEEAAAVLVILSPASLKSYWVHYEIGYASALRKRVLPYLTHPSLDTPGYIRDLKYFTTIEQIHECFAGDFRVGFQGLDATIVPSQTSQTSERFEKVQSILPKLLVKMRDDLANDKTQTIREFLVVPSRTMPFRSSKPRFAYYETEHESLLNKIDLLENHGFVFVADIGSTGTRIYRMTEEFVGLLTSAGLTT